MGKSGFFKDFFSYSRAERTGIIVLLIILILIIIIPSILPEKKLDGTEQDELRIKVDEFELKLAEQIKNENKAREPFVFDPNKADSADFCRLGFSSAQTEVILRYRNRGGIFRKAEDFKQIYVVSDTVFERLKPYIHIPQNKLIRIELNSADSVDLMQIHGIGSYYARKIIERRNVLGGFTHIEQLTEIRGIDEERLGKFKEQLTINRSVIQKININTVTAGVLRKHPYFDTQAVTKIMRLRKTKGKIGSLDQLIDEDVFTTQQAEKIKPYVVFD